MAEQLPALSRLGLLGHLDTQHFGIDQVGRGESPKLPEAICLMWLRRTLPKRPATIAALDLFSNLLTMRLQIFEKEKGVTSRSLVTP